MSLVRNKRKKSLQRHQQQHHQQQQGKKEGDAKSGKRSSASSSSQPQTLGIGGEPITTPTTISTTPCDVTLSPASSPGGGFGSQHKHSRQISALSGIGSGVTETKDDDDGVDDDAASCPSSGSCEGSSSSSCSSESSASPVPLVWPVALRLSPGSKFHPPSMISYGGEEGTNGDGDDASCGASSMSASPDRAADNASEAGSSRSFGRGGTKSGRGSRWWKRRSSAPPDTGGSSAAATPNKSNQSQQDEDDNDDEIAMINAAAAAATTPLHAELESRLSPQQQQQRTQRAASLSCLSPGIEHSGVWRRPRPRTAEIAPLAPYAVRSLSTGALPDYLPPNMSPTKRRASTKNKADPLVSPAKSSQTLTTIPSLATCHSTSENSEASSTVSAHIKITNSLSSGSHSLPAVLSPAYKFQPIDSDSSDSDGDDSGIVASNKDDNGDAVQSVELGSTTDPTPDPKREIDLSGSGGSSSSRTGNGEALELSLTKSKSDSLHRYSFGVPSIESNAASATLFPSNVHGAGSTELEPYHPHRRLPVDRVAAGIRHQQQRGLGPGAPTDASCMAEWNFFDIPLLLGRCICDWAEADRPNPR